MLRLLLRGLGRWIEGCLLSLSLTKVELYGRRVWVMLMGLYLSLCLVVEEVIVEKKRPMKKLLMRKIDCDGQEIYDELVEKKVIQDHLPDQGSEFPIHGLVVLLRGIRDIDRCRR